MGVELYVDDESIEGPFFSKKFIDEVIYERCFKFDEFLTKEEQKIITPNSYGEIVLGKKREPTFLEKAKLPIILHKAMKGKISVEEINKLRDKIVYRSEKVTDRERDPQKMKKTFQKIEDYLIANSSRLPLVHEIYETKELENKVYSLIIKEAKCEIEGDLFYEDDYDKVRMKIHLKSYNEDFAKVDFYIDVEPEIEINGKIYFTKSITKAEQFHEQFQDCYNFLEVAIKSKKRVLWEFS